MGGMLHLPQPPSVPPVRPAAPAAAVAKALPKAVPKPPPKKGLPDHYGNYTNMRFVLRRFGGELATEHRGSKELNVCPRSKLEGAGHCACRAGKHLRPSHLHPKDFLDHLARDHGSDPAHREQAMAMTNGVMPRGLAGPIAAAQAGSKALALPAGRAHRASSSATSSGAHGFAAVSSTGSTGAGVSGGGTALSTTVSRETHQATAPSTGGQRGSVSGRAKGSSHLPPVTGARGPPPSGEPDLAGDPDPAAQP